MTAHPFPVFPSAPQATPERKYTHPAAYEDDSLSPAAVEYFINDFEAGNFRPEDDDDTMATNAVVSEIGSSGVEEVTDGTMSSPEVISHRNVTIRTPKTPRTPQRGGQSVAPPTPSKGAVKSPLVDRINTTFYAAANDARSHNEAARPTPAHTSSGAQPLGFQSLPVPPHTPKMRDLKKTVTVFSPRSGTPAASSSASVCPGTPAPAPAMSTLAPRCGTPVPTHEPAARIETPAPTLRAPSASGSVFSGSPYFVPHGGVFGPPFRIPFDRTARPALVPASNEQMPCEFVSGEIFVTFSGFFPGIVLNGRLFLQSIDGIPGVHFITFSNARSASRAWHKALSTNTVRACDVTEINGSLELDHLFESMSVESPELAHFAGRPFFVVIKGYLPGVYADMEPLIYATDNIDGALTKTAIGLTAAVKEWRRALRAGEVRVLDRPNDNADLDEPCASPKKKARLGDPLEVSNTATQTAHDSSIFNASPLPKNKVSG
ncbi:hypothetical protein HGRIS_000544 [Hohenbuehelia grisea]|uniref:Uncharacterized protein n=1 Tax=Hohenbuehelia grisea TaxID=104357 RepID=A0ABR3JSY8_9AGAR